MLPAAKSHRFSLAEVVPNCLAALRGEQAAWGLPHVRRAVVVLVDGLGAVALRDHAGHARRLLAAGSGMTMDSGFPPTTVSAIATLTTGQPSGRHGLVGYRSLDPDTGRLVTLLGPDIHPPTDPSTWQRVPTLFEQATDVTSVAIGPARYRGSAFSAAVLRGAEYRGAESIAERFAAVRSLARGADPQLLYLYVPELDVAAHQDGVASDAWIAALEELDAAFGAFIGTLRSDEGVLVTADHGILDIPATAHVLVDPALLSGVRCVAGEPRCLQLHLVPGEDPDAHAARWREADGARAWVATRAEAIAAGWFGTVEPEVAPRIGDVLVAARRRIAYYTDPLDRGRGMVGQHGSLTAEETAVPLLRFGAFAPAG